MYCFKAMASYWLGLCSTQGAQRENAQGAQGLKLESMFSTM
jgi:hypothetical protein